MTPTNTALTTTTQLTDTDIRAIRLSGESTTALAIREANTLQIVTAPDYQSADMTLFKIRAARKEVATLIEDRVDSIINPIRKGLDKLYAAKRALVADLDTPLERAEKVVKGKMAKWQADQAREKEEAERLRREEEARLRRAQEEAERARQAAERQAVEVKSKREREAAAAKAWELAREQEEIAKQQAVAQERPKVAETVKGAGSRVTVTVKWRVSDMNAFIAGVIAETIPEEALQVNEEVVNALWGQDRSVVAAWPGVTTYNETKVSGR